MGYVTPDWIPRREKSEAGDLRAPLLLGNKIPGNRNREGSEARRQGRCRCVLPLARPGTDSAGCADFPEGLPSEREGRKRFSTGFGSPLGQKFVLRGAHSFVFLCLHHARTGAPASQQGSPSGREARGLRWPGPEARSPRIVPESRPSEPFCRAGTKGSRSQVARKRTPDAVPEGRRRKWILGFTYHLLPHPVPMGDTAIHLAEAARNLRDSLTAPFPWYLYSTQNISETCSLLSILTTTLRIEAPISSRGDPCLLHELWSSFAPSPTGSCHHALLVKTLCWLSTAWKDEGETPQGGPRSSVWPGPPPPLVTRSPLSSDPA